MALSLAQDLYEQVIAHARACFPEEACGILAGSPGSGQATRFIPMDNAAPVATREYAYRFNATQQLAAYRDMDERGEDPIAFMHSHPFTEARPSTVDIALAAEPDVRYLIVSLKDPANPEVRAWLIRDGQAIESRHLPP